MEASNTRCPPAPSCASRPDSARSLFNNTGWVLLSEGATRASRLVTILVMAAALPMAEYGLAMLALACHEILRTLTRFGAAARVVQCGEQALERVAGNVHVLNAAIALMVFSVQFFLAPVFAKLYGMAEIAPILQVMAFSYLLYPLVAVSASALQRMEQMRSYSLCNAAAVVADNLGTAVLLLCGAGLWSIAIAKIIAAAVWAIAIARSGAPRFTIRFDLHSQLELLRFSAKIFCSDALRTLRGQIDILLAGKLLDQEVFGLYAFAKSAGVGISIALSNAFLAVAYPRLAAAHRLQELMQENRRLKWYALFIAALFILQSLLAPFYVTWLFDPRWHGAAGLVALLCLSAIPALYLDLFCLQLRIRHRLAAEMGGQLFACTALGLGLVLIAPASTKSFALAVVLLSLLWVLPLLNSAVCRFRRLCMPADRPVTTN